MANNSCTVVEQVFHDLNLEVSNPGTTSRGSKLQTSITSCIVLHYYKVVKHHQVASGIITYLVICFGDTFARNPHNRGRLGTINPLI